MSKFTFSIDIEAAPDAVWQVLLDVERWPEWTSTVRSASLLTPVPFTLGSSARIHQPKLAPATWSVTEFDPQARSFTWTTRSPGVLVRAAHAITQAPAGCTLTLTLDYTGVLGPLVARIYRNLSRKNLEIEATGLKRRCEQ